ncbi:proteasome assembly chaperone 2 isoform X2 [Arvicanthis niloticus]|uniref:proteasome assembly chaperone 2 isoform X2 n=1 Tax=Arvicanthis niloticus TaxID=61156 RepID=UPI0014868F55|nr:proteasome assembly chaperone 2 isoform X2 [Arvicanthis niloticus]
MFVPCGESVPDLTNFTLLMPAVSVGNVGQLAIDLIISTLNMCKIGYFYTDCLVPMVGNNPYATEEENSNELSINTEVYSLPSRKLVVLQLRSIFIKYKSKSFCEKLLAWVESSSFARIIVLSSSHSYHRNDAQLRSTPFRYLLTPCLQKNVQNKIKSLNWLEMEKSRCIPEMSDSEFCIRIPGGGITKTLYDERATTPQSLPCHGRSPALGGCSLAVDFLPHCFDVFSFSFVPQRSQNQLLGMCWTEFCVARGCVRSAIEKRL